MTFSKTIKTLLITILVALTLLFSQSPMAFAGATAFTALQNNSKMAAPTEANKNVTSEIMKNSDFTNTGSTTSTQIYSATDWTLSSKEDQDNIKYGIIDLSKLNDNAEYYGVKDEKPLITEASEKKVLMFNSSSKTAGSKLNYSQDITLEANSFYKISVNVLTSKNAFGSIYLDNANFDEASSKMESIITTQNWNIVYFYVATSAYSSQKVNLNLYLGNKTTPSTGYVLFDNIYITQYSQNKFDALTSVLPTTSRLIDQRATKITSSTEDGFVNTNFNEWTNEASSNEAETETIGTNYLGSKGNLNGIAPGTNFTNETQNGVAFSTKKGFISKKSPDIKIKRNGLYKISFFAKGEISEGNMNVVLSGKINNMPEGEESTTISASLTTLKTDQNKFFNDWNEYSFYVKGNPLYDTTINLSLGLGSESNKATGYVMFAYVNSYHLTNNEFENGQSVGTTTTLTMAKQPTLNFANSAFNQITINTNPALPSEPANWVYETSNANAALVHGVVNTLSGNWTAYTSLASNVINPLTKFGDYSNNTLVLYNNAPSYQGYHNDTNYTISADKYYLATVDVNLQRNLLTNIASGAFVYIKDSNGNTIAWARYDAENAGNTWQTIKFFIRGSFQDRSITPYIYLGTKDKPTGGVVFFDNFKIEESTEDAFNAANTSNLVKKVDLTDALFTQTNGSNNRIYTPSLWELTAGDDSIDTAKLGIIENNNLPGFLTKSPINEGTDFSNMLMIGSVEEQHYAYRTALGYDLDSSNYYKISVDVKTLMLSHTVNTEIEDENTPFGANINLYGLENSAAENISTQTTQSKFTNLTDALNDQNNKFVTYTFYLYPSEAKTIYVELSLGKENQLCSGYAFFKNLKIEKIDENTYDSDIAILTNNNKTSLPSSVINLVNKTEKSDDPSESYTNNNDWWAAVFTIIIAAAVLVALIGFAIRRYNEKRKEEVSVSNNYDRLETLLKDVDRRNRTTEINTKIRNLQEELKQSEKFLKDEQQSFEKEKSQYETAKEIANDTGIAIDSPQKKLDKMQKNIEELEQKIAGIELDIEVLEEEKQRIKKQEKQSIEKAKKTKVIKTRK